MFIIAGKGGSCKKKDQGSNSSISEALTQAAVAIQVHFHLHLTFKPHGKSQML